ncbi:MAG TPA: hypothetical protein VJI32_04710 [Candidatus Nanoarchaeia archaeon]|nr:hypothetical protein [Candidatus Nanoarchaeia archaeon]
MALQQKLGKGLFATGLVATVLFSQKGAYMDYHRSSVEKSPGIAREYFSNKTEIFRAYRYRDNLNALQKNMGKSQFKHADNYALFTDLERTVEAAISLSQEKIADMKTKNNILEHNPVIQEAIAKREHSERLFYAYMGLMLMSMFAVVGGYNLSKKA